jgi:small-conductance mechanosensitive channel
MLATFFRLIGEERAVEIAGIRLVGVNAENGKKLLITLVFLLIVLAMRTLVRVITQRFVRGEDNTRFQFWARQVTNLTTAVVVLLGLLSIWFDDPTRLATGLGLVTAGLAFALQKVVTAIAGYFIILRGKTFNVGDRIRMGGVRGDVIALDFTQTTIMEMGQPPSVQSDEPAMWVRSRQYTGRVVTVSNAKIFDEPVYNYSRDFPYVWEEMNLPIAYDGDQTRVEQILPDAARRHTVDIARLSEDVLQEMQRRYFMTAAPTGAAVYYRLTDNWVEMTVRFVVEDHGIRELKDRLSRDILAGLKEAGISTASSTIQVTGLPELKLAGMASETIPAIPKRPR